MLVHSVDLNPNETQSETKSNPKIHVKLSVSAIKKNNIKLYSWYRVISNLCILDRYSKYVKNSATNKKHLYTEDNLAGISHVIRYEEVPLYSYPQMYYFCDT